MPETKQCPFCKEEIHAEAIKCKHCGSMLNEQSSTTIIEAFSTKYEILEEIGRGGMATVYKAKQKNLNRIVALKVVPKEFTHDKEFVTRFQREAQSAAKLNHHNIITIHDVGEIGGYPYIAMEYLEGGDLHQKIKKEGVLSEKETKKIILPIIDALGYAHEQGIIHRDIKSSNIMLGKKGRPVLMDFGIAKSTEGTKLTKTGTIIGTPEYMSPEQASGSSDVDNRSDIYSLGIVMYEMATGKVPFHADTALGVLSRVVNDYPTNPKELNAKLADGLVNILLKSISKKADDRFQSCEEFAESIKTGKVEFKEQEKAKIKKKKREPKQQTSVFPKILFSLLLLAIIVIVGIIITNTQKHQEISSILQTAENYFKHGSYDKAKERYYSVLEIDTGNEAAKTGLKLIESERRRQLELAEAEAEKLRKQKEAEAEKLRKEKAFFDNMVFVQGGTFQMGSNNGGSDEKPVHEVYISNFYIGKNEVTNAEYIKFLNAKGVSSNGSFGGTEYIDMDDDGCAIGYRNNKFYFRGNKYAEYENCPVIEVTWYGAKAYCEWKGGRLPTEAEWEYAARGGNKSNGYKYSGSNDIGSVAWYLSSKTHSVGGKKANELGIYDMSGNVWEWCSDWYAKNYYKNSPQNNPQGPSSGDYSVFRGGSWCNSDVSVAVRNGNIRDYGSCIYGFRIARTP